MWTPDVYQGAPTSITNFFAIVPKAVGLAVIIRFMDLPFKNILEEWQIIIIFISIASMILGSVAAIGQKLDRFSEEDQEELYSLSIQFTAHSFNDSLWVKQETLLEAIPALVAKSEQVLKKSNYLVTITCPL